MDFMSPGKDVARIFSVDKNGKTDEMKIGRHFELEKSFKGNHYFLNEV